MKGINGCDKTSERRSYTVEVLEEMLMTGRLCWSVPRMVACVAAYAVVDQIQHVGLVYLEPEIVK